MKLDDEKKGFTPYRKKRAIKLNVGFIGDSEGRWDTIFDILEEVSYTEDANLTDVYN